MVVRATRRLPYVLYVQDLWPDSVTASGFLISEAGTRRARATPLLAPPTTGLRTSQCQRPGWHASCSAACQAGRSASCRTGPTSGTSNLGSVISTRHGPFMCSAPTVLMYAGNFGETTEPGDGYRSRRASGIVTTSSSLWLAQASRRRGSALRPSNTTFGNARLASTTVRARTSDVLALADAQLVTLKDVPVLRSTLPSKLQANLAAGQPIMGQ